MPERKSKDKDSTKDNEGSHRRKPERSHRKASKSPERGTPSASGSTTRRKKSTTSDKARPRSSHHRSSPASSKTSLPYPTFSKAHSKESVNGDVPANPFTPNPTDLAAKRHDREQASPRATTEAGTRGNVVRGVGAVPPSPPLTSMSEQLRRQTSEPEGKAAGDASDNTAKRRGTGRGSDTKPPKDAAAAESVPAKPDSKRAAKVTQSQEQSERHGDAPSLQVTGEGKGTPVDETFSNIDRRPRAGSVVDSEGTSVTEVLPRPTRPSIPNDVRTSNPVPSPDRTRPSASRYWADETPTRRTEEIVISRLPDGLRAAELSPQPPPPPPPPAIPSNIPRVDYLLHHGGLAQNVPRRLFEAGHPRPFPYAPPAPRCDGAFSPGPAGPAALVDDVFAPYHALLQQYETVISQNGSLAVATGYRSIARRLLDRLEAVFARDISSEMCACPFCQHPDCLDREAPGLGWGDVLEWVSGRKQLPQWPPFDFEALGLSLASGENPAAVMEATLQTKMHSARPASVDTDVPSEFREHYRRQTKKKKEAVDRWLASQLVNPTAPPQGIDDETLTFAILTHLRPPERDYFNELLGFASSARASSMSDDGAGDPSALLPRTAFALQRLYRLAAVPRDPETAAYMVKYPTMHQVLATLAAVHPSEWDILTSGRFDGFLWGGAEDLTNLTSPPASGAPTPWRRDSAGLRSVSPGERTASAAGAPGEISRDGTPAHAPNAGPSRGVTPAIGPPVSHDEETEIAVLAEVERDIYLSMEALEDAIEALHQKAELVRLALRERGAGLSMAAQSRRQLWSGQTSALDGARGTPSIGHAFQSPGLGTANWESEDDAQWGTKDVDVTSDVWPDDSASNVSSSRVRRPKRRTERRTPAPVEECDEGD